MATTISTGSISPNYLPMFIVGGTLYLVALIVIHLLAPRLEPATLRSGE